MHAHGNWSPWSPFKHHGTALEVDHNAKLFDDWPAHQHRRLTFDDERLCETHHTVDKDGNRSDPMAGGRVITAKVKGS